MRKHAEFIWPSSVRYVLQRIIQNFGNLSLTHQFEQDQAIQKTNKVRCRPKECRAEFQLGSFQVNGDEMGVRYPQISDPSDLSDRETEKYIESDNSLDVSSEPTNDNFLILQLTTILN